VVTQFVKEFRDFISRGSVVDLAVGIVIGAAFTAVVNSFVSNVLTAFIGAIVGKPNFNDLSLTIGHGVVAYGRFVTATLNFLLVGFGLFLIVKAVNGLRRREEPEPKLTEKDVLLEIRDLLRVGADGGQGPASSAGK
jgi:large conductance mechanosensitive channel